MRGSGLPPPMRGTDHVAESAPPGGRFIPARAGNRLELYTKDRFIALYPRPCGEQTPMTERSRKKTGLSPPVRGTDEVDLDLHLPARFIPARAGNSSKAASIPSRYAVYPRPCGEQSRIARIERAPNGLSPPVRGTEPTLSLIAGRPRFIPARAGNRSYSRPSWSRLSVYPRPCGEQYWSHCWLTRNAGLSPPVRGTGR